eukprot:tig00020611_g12099.t1
MDEMKATGIEAGTEWREEIGRGLRMAKAVVFVASPVPSISAPDLSPRRFLRLTSAARSICASDCMLELSRALDLGKPLSRLRLRTELDPARGAPPWPRHRGLHDARPVPLSFIGSLTPRRPRRSDELFESDGGGRAEGALGLLAHRTRAATRRRPFCFVWSSPEVRPPAGRPAPPRAAPPRAGRPADAPHAAAAAARRRCAATARGGGGSRALALRRFVPLLGASSSSSPALASRLKVPGGPPAL